MTMTPVRLVSRVIRRHWHQQSQQHRNKAQIEWKRRRTFLEQGRVDVLDAVLGMPYHPAHGVELVLCEEPGVLVVGQRPDLAQDLLGHTQSITFISILLSSPTPIAVPV